MNEDHRRPAAFAVPEPKPRRKPHSIAGLSFPREEEEGEFVAPALPVKRWRGWGTVLAGSLAALAVLWAGLAATQLVEAFFARSPLLGWFATAIAGLAGLSALAIALREILGLARLGRIAHIREDAARALDFGDAAAGERALAALIAAHRRRPDARWGLQELDAHTADVLKPAERLRLAERCLVAPRDAEAHRIVARAARRVTLITAVTPMAALDILFVAVQNLRMLRELATLYGGRPASLATLKLARMVLGHLAVTGGLALSDSLLQHMVGKGLIGRLSARFGEGAVNGILTARIGLAARDLCRPIPQEAAARETLGGLLKELVARDGGEAG
jgi:putative membrane protein